VEERFWANVAKGAEDECWLWLGARVPKGYGVATGDRGKYVRAHRMSWAIHFGDVPKGMWVLHRCDNPPCVNPAHLFLGTNADNVADMWDKGRAKPHGVPVKERRGA
jgi:hypothetical protein